jgi:hypothetical protein
MIKQQQSNRPAGANQANGLYRSSGELRERGGYVGHVAESSLYTRASLHPLLTGSALVGAGLVVAALLRTKPPAPDSEIGRRFKSETEQQEEGTRRSLSSACTRARPRKYST